MKKKLRLAISGLLIIAIVLTGEYFLKSKIFKPKEENLININELSEEFMDDYLNEVRNLNLDDYDEENLLIVTSTKKITNDYGAVSVVEAPNNQYFVQYKSTKDKNVALSKFKELKEVINVDENHEYELFESNYNSWGIEKVGFDKAINALNNRELEDVTVAIIDSGCDMELFNQNYADKIIETYNLYDGEDMYDNFGHGTHITGTIAEATTSNVHIFSVKTSDSRVMNTATIITAINYINYYHKADVINMSFGSEYYDESLSVAISSALDNGIISVAAAGNSAESTANYPAAFSTTISVSAVDSELKIADFSNYGDTVTFAAPGVDIVSINGIMSGTSMATPHVVSAVAILKSFNKNLSLEEAINILKKYAIDLGDPGKDIYYGYGLINLSNIDDLAYEAVNNSISDFEFKNVQLTKRNYGNITNLMNIQVALYDENGNEYIKYLSDLDNLEIYGYDAFNCSNQNIRIKYNDIEKELKIENRLSSCSIIDAYATSIPSEEQTTSIYQLLLKNEVKKIYIPEYIDGSKVTAIGEEVFAASNVESIILPSSIISIGDKAFNNCTSLKSVIGGADEISIGDYAFANDIKLANFEAKISNIGISSFEGDLSLDNINLSNNLKVLPNSCFANCSSLEHINLHSNLEKIESLALSNTRIKDLHIFKNWEVDSEAFKGMNALETIVVEDGHPTYDSRNNSNALINTADNSIILGSANTKIPSTVVSINDYAFFNNSRLETIDTNNVESIGISAFENCSSLKTFYLRDSVKNLDKSIFTNSTLVKVYAYNADFEPTLILGSDPGINGLIIIMPDEVIVNGENEYRDGDIIDDIEIKLRYTKYTKSGALVYYEPLTTKYTVTYQRGNCIRYGDSYYTINATTQHGIDIEKKVDIVVKKRLPEYTIPTNLVAKIGQKLSEIELPSGFEWMNGTQIIDKVGEVSYKAKFIPNDTNTYEVVEDIDIILTVYKQKYDVRFYANDGSNNSVIQEIDTFVATPLFKNTFTRDNYTFIGWNTKADGTGTEYSDEQVVNLDNDLVLYAQWKKNHISITNVVLSDTEITLSVDRNKTKTLTANIEPSNAEDDKTITWSSSDSSIAKVNQSGKVIAVAKGEAVITATSSNGVTATCRVTVKGVTGWVTENGQKYYYEDGEMQKGVIEIDSKWYHFGENSGQLKVGDSKTLDGRIYYSGNDGVIKTDWYTVNGQKYYATVETGAYKGVKKIDGKWYHFGENSGQVKVGDSKTLDGRIYYSGNDGVIKTGWYTANGQKYYAAVETGAYKGVKKIDDKYYHFGENSGQLKVGDSKTLDGRIYYSNKDGVIQEEWYTANGQKYYATVKTGAYKGIKKIDDKYYHFGENSGQLKVGDSKTLDGRIYYSDKDGVIQTGWYTSNGQKYYATVETGAYKGVKEIDGKYYHFGENSGQLKIGWSQTLNGKRYYSNKEGVLQKGNILINGKWYSFNEDYSLR